jgi:uncharacterized RDD family membrane protein YckC
MAGPRGGRCPVLPSAKVVEPIDEDPPHPGVIGSLVGRVAPIVMRQIDTNDLVDALDIDVIAADLDLDALIERLDINAIADRLDLDALIERLDIDAIAGRLDLESLMGRLDMAQLAAGAGQDVAVSGMDLVRRQVVRADALVEGGVDRILRRDARARPDAPGTHTDGASEAEVTDPHALERRDVSGHYAGPVTRGLAVFVDVSAVFALNSAFVAVTLFLLGRLTDSDPSPAMTGAVTLGFLSVLSLTWFWIAVALFGRTPAMALMGVAVVKRDGHALSGKRALVRTLVLPVSLLLPFLFLGMVVGKERRTLHDVAAGSVVVYDWGSRDAQQPVTIRQQLSARARRRQVEEEAPIAA